MTAHLNTPSRPFTHQLRHRIALVAGTALAAGMLAGCSTTGMTARANVALKAQTALAKGDTGKAINLAEAAVAASPQDAALRV
ncbi:MAG: hypothetical protein ABIQ66_01345, partial [Novosphingobium sp.]